jgi:dihydroneopterin aldolase
VDKIIIQDLEIHARHGVLSQEKELGQLFIISLEIGANLEVAGQSDNLTQTIHYGDICRDVEAAMKAVNFNLIEAAAFHIIKILFRDYPLIDSVKVILKKPWAPIAKHLGYVAVEMERTRKGSEGF